jgi:predicted GNAT family acetyltransferase
MSRDLEAEMGPEIRDNQQEHRFEVVIDGHLGAAYYAREKGVITFTHTDVAPELGGRGIGTMLARFALDQARAEGLKVVPLCPFIAAFIKRHPEYQELVLPGSPRVKPKA